MRWKVITVTEDDTEPGLFKHYLISQAGVGITVISDAASRIEPETIILADETSPSVTLARRGLHSLVFLDSPPVAEDVKQAWGQYSCPRMRAEIQKTARETYVEYRLRQCEKAMSQGKPARTLLQELLTELANRIPAQSIDRWLTDPPPLPQDA